MTDGPRDRPDVSLGGKVSELGESELLQVIAQRLGGAPSNEVWAGDDTAVVVPPSGAQLFTIDTLVEGVDFDLTYATGADIAWKSLATNVSDIAAMCGAPSHAVTSLSLPGTTSITFFDGFLDGLIYTADRWNVALVGGDISGADRVSVSIAVIGTSYGSQPVLRSGARPGHDIYVTGALGGAAGGLMCLREGRTGEASAPLISRQLRPEPRVAEAEYLAAFAPTSMIDLSDGLARDLDRLMSASGVGCMIDPSLIPVDPGLLAVGLADPFDMALTGGEDFELLFTLDPATATRDIDLTAPSGVHLTKIGTVTEGERLVGDQPLHRWRDHSWDHLS